MRQRRDNPEMHAIVFTATRAAANYVAQALMMSAWNLSDGSKAPLIADIHLLTGKSQASITLNGAVVAGTLSLQQSGMSITRQAAALQDFGVRSIESRHVGRLTPVMPSYTVASRIGSHCQPAADTHTHKLCRLPWLHAAEERAPRACEYRRGSGRH
jgi:hypothetical protein